MEYVARTAHQLGKAFRSRRKQLGLSQSEVAATAGLLQTQISVIESHDAKATVTTLYKALSALGLELVLREIGGPQAPGRRSRTEW